MKLRYYPASAFVSDETFERLLRASTVTPLEAEDLRWWRRHWRARLMRQLRPPSVRRNEARTKDICDQSEGLKELDDPLFFLRTRARDGG